jgi:hypothetical protein
LKILGKGSKTHKGSKIVETLRLIIIFLDNATVHSNFSRTCNGSLIKAVTFYVKAVTLRKGSNS